MSAPTPTPRLTSSQRHRHSDMTRWRDTAAAALKRLTDPVLADAIRRGAHVLVDGWPAGVGSDAYRTGTSGSSSTEAAALALCEGEPADTSADDLREIHTRLAEIAGHAAAIDRALDNLRRGTGWDPGRYDPTCRNCGDKASNHPDQPGWRLILERCRPCYDHWHTTGEERPRGRTFGGAA